MKIKERRSILSEPLNTLQLVVRKAVFGSGGGQVPTEPPSQAISPSHISDSALLQSKKRSSEI